MNIIMRIIRKYHTMKLGEHPLNITFIQIDEICMRTVKENEVKYVEKYLILNAIENIQDLNHSYFELKVQIT